MIKISRPAAPPYFHSAGFKSLLAELDEQKSSKSQQRFRFRPEVNMAARPDLTRMFQAKCAYCESPLGTASEGDVDNFRPKGGARGFDAFSADHYGWLAYEWDNLYLCCQICNRKYKCNWFPVEDEGKRAPIGTKGQALLLEKPLLLDPCQDNPEQHLAFRMDGSILARTARGKATIDILGLNRKELVQQRIEAMGKLLLQLNHYSVAPGAKSRLHGYVDKLFSDAPPQTYAATERAVFQRWYKSNKDTWDRTSPEKAVRKPPAVQDLVSKQAKIPAAPSAKIRQVAAKLNSALNRFSIKSISITNFRNVCQLKLEIPPASNPDQPQESWMLMLGDNGVGKSSILQAIALTLIGNRELMKLNPDPKDILRWGQTEGSVVIESYEHDEPVRLNFDAKKISTSIVDAPTFIIAYGSTRLLPKGGIQPIGRRSIRTNVCNLFDCSAALTDVHRWLARIGAGAFNERIAPVLFDLLDLDADERIVFRKGRLSFELPGRDIDLEKVSDGYKGIIAMACDIMKTLWVEGAGYHTMQGVVLVDELGNHLHPKWRLKIAGALRRAFPRLQFIVSTHEPLCLRGLAHGEVVVLQETSHDCSIIQSKDLPDHNLLSIDQLLTSDLFGLIDTQAPEMEKEYQEYYALLGKKPSSRTKHDKSKIEEYRQRLSNNEMTGDTPQSQIVNQVVHEVWAKKIEDKGFKTIAGLKEETVSEVKSILAEKNLDWI